MVLNNKVLLIGTPRDIEAIHKELTEIFESRSDVQSHLTANKLHKRMRRVTIEDPSFVRDHVLLTISFQCKVQFIQPILEGLRTYPVRVESYTENQNHQVWIVSNFDLIISQQWIPDWAIREIFISYMSEMDSPVMLDGYQTIQFEPKTHKLFIRDKTLSSSELHHIFFNEWIKRRPVYEYLENFTRTFYESCINNYDDLYVSNNNEIWEGERTSPLALFIVTFGIFGIILLFIYFTGII